MVKKWLAVLGVAVLVAGCFQMLWATGSDGTLDEHPWVGATGNGTSSTASTSLQVRAGFSLGRIYIVRPAPMGGFYILRITVPSGAAAKTIAGAKKLGD